MPKPYTFPTLYDNMKTVSISFLSKHGYLQPNQEQSGIMSWSRNGEKIGSISIKVDMKPESCYLELDYTCDKVSINYRVELVSISSNLGKGLIWYFVCPSTGKRCRKLYLIDSYFYHRSAFVGCLYDSQTKSKKYREMDKNYGQYFRLDQLYEQMHKKHFTKQYAGKPTKKYLKLTEQIREAESVSFEEIEMAMVK